MMPRTIAREEWIMGSTLIETNGVLVILLGIELRRLRLDGGQSESHHAGESRSERQCW